MDARFVNCGFIRCVLQGVLESFQWRHKTKKEEQVLDNMRSTTTTTARTQRKYCITRSI